MKDHTLIEKIFTHVASAYNMQWPDVKRYGNQRANLTATLLLSKSFDQHFIGELFGVSNACVSMHLKTAKRLYNESALFKTTYRKIYNSIK